MGPKGSHKSDYAGKAATGKVATKAATSSDVIFEVNDAVMAADTQFTSKGELYKARVVRCHLVDDADQNRRYLIHYQGWSRKYDIWVEANQIALESDIEAVKKLAERQVQKKAAATAVKKEDKDQEAEAEARETRSSDNAEAEGEEPPLKKQNTASSTQLSMQEKMEEDREIKKHRTLLANSDLQQETEASTSALADMNIPVPLKRHLVDEWSLIAEKDPKRLLKMPRQKHVQAIFEDFLTYKTVKDKATDKELEKLQEFSESMSLYFDRALSVSLLYRWERDQFDNIQIEIEEKKLRPSVIYGGEHLTRMFVYMARQIPSLVIGKEELNQFKNNIADFLKFFGKPSSIAQYIIPEDYVLAEQALNMRNEEEIEGITKKDEETANEGGKSSSSSSSSSSSKSSSKSPAKSHPSW